MQGAARDYDWLSGAERSRAKYQPEEERQGRALCLSGGGYRAALFHLGALTRLNELGILAQIDTFSSVSGGSIVTALLADRIRSALLEGRIPSWPHRGRILDWRQEIADPLRGFTRENIRTLWVLQLLLPGRWPASTIAVRSLEARYRRDITEIRLDQLPERPHFIFNATDMAFGVDWRSEREHVGDHQAGYAHPSPAWSIARAVAASSCFPPIFNPLPIDLSPRELEDGEARFRADRGELIEGLRLTDGGVYDNMGLEPVWKSHELVLVSDGGATFDFAPDRGLAGRLGRYTAIVQEQASAIRKRWLISSYVEGDLAGAYWGIGSAPESYDKRAPGYSARLVDDYVSEVRTDLDAFSDGEQAILENHGYLIADAAIRQHAPELLPTPVAPTQPPHPAWMNEGQVKIALARSAKRQLFGRWRKASLAKAQSPEGTTATATALLERHRPLIQYDSQESYYADSPAELTDLEVPAAAGTAGHANTLRRADGTIIAAAAPSDRQTQLKLDFLAGESYANGQEVLRDDYLDASGKDYVADARRLHEQAGYAHTIYGRARHDRRGELWLQYWFFYYYNDKAFAGIGLHEGDWEMIQVRLGRGERPAEATYAQHAGAERAAWSELEREQTGDGEAPIVYSARGSHASYFRAGTHQAPVGYDHNDGRGLRIRPELRVISDDGPGWALWPGFWGSTRRRAFWESDSPRGPREHARWWDPAAFHASARPAAEIAKGAQAGAELPAPPAPEIAAAREGDRAVIRYRLPAPAPGQPAPDRIVLTVNAEGDARPPSTYSSELRADGGAIEHPLPLGEDRYTVTASAVTGDGLASRTVDAPLETVSP